MTMPIEVDNDKISSFCRRHFIARLSFFGSVLRPDFRDDSDVDVLVEFDPKHVPGLLALIGMEEELSGYLGRQVDLRTPKELSRYFRDDVLRSALVQYAGTASSTVPSSTSP